MPYEITQYVTCHPAEVTFPPLPQPKLVLDLATPEGCKAELTSSQSLIDVNAMSSLVLSATEHVRQVKDSQERLKISTVLCRDEWSKV